MASDFFFFFFFLLLEMRDLDKLKSKLGIIMEERMHDTCQHNYICIGNHTVFEFNLELICTSEFFKKLKLHEPLRRVQFQLFEKLTSAN